MPKDDDKDKLFARAIAVQNGAILDLQGDNPAIDYILKKQQEAKDSDQARLPTLGEKSL